MADTTPTTPTDPWVLRINALADAFKGMATPTLALLAAISGFYGGFHSQQASSQANSNAAKIDTITAKVDDTAKMMTARSSNAWANPTPAPVPTR